MFKKPKANVPPTIYILPFAEGVWICAMCGLIISLIFIVLIIILNPSSKMPSELTGEWKKWSFWLLLGTFLNAAFSEPPGYSGRVVFFTLLTAAMLTFAYYTSVFTGFLTYREVKLPFRNLKEMVTNKDYELLVVNQTAVQAYFQQANGGVFQKAWQRIAQDRDRNLVCSYEDGYAKILTGKYVLSCDRPGAHFLAKGSCEVAFTEPFMKHDYFFAARNEFPYSSLLSYSLIRLAEAGILNRLKNKHLRADTSLCGQGGGSSDTLGFSQVYTLFIFLLLMIFLSVITLLLEIMFYKHFQLTDIKNVQRPYLLDANPPD